MENGHLVAHLNYHKPCKLLTIETCGEGETDDCNAIKEVLTEDLFYRTTSRAIFLMNY